MSSKFGPIDHGVLLNFCQIQQLTTELAALECLKNQFLHFFSVASDLILFKLADMEEMHNTWMYSNLAILDDRQQRHPPLIPLGVTMGENGVYSFSCLFTYLRTIQTILMTCRLSGERSLPLRLHV